LLKISVTLMQPALSCQKVTQLMMNFKLQLHVFWSQQQRSTNSSSLTQCQIKTKTH